MRLSIPALLLFCTMPALAQAGDLTVNVDEVRNANGQILGALYSSADTFMNPADAVGKFKVPAATGEVRYVFHDLKPGRYAFSVFHDENGNGRLDKNTLGVPTEGYGFSNDAQGSGGPPKFEQAAFDFDGKSGAITVTLNY